MPYIDFEHVTVREVTRHFGRRRALSKVSLKAQAGEILGLLGPNGSGKSTLLGLLSTLTTPTSGEIRYGNLTATEAGTALRGCIGLLAHDLHLYLELSARENLAFFAGLFGVSEPETCVARALGRAGLDDRRDDHVAGFSRGMRQRLALERALVHEPRLVLLDEPFTGLDEGAGRGLIERLMELRALGCIVIVATHDLDLVDGLIDRAVVLNGGRLITLPSSDGTLRARYRQAVGARGV